MTADWKRVGMFHKNPSNQVEDNLVNSGAMLFAECVANVKDG
jgi:hypothetical protein